MLIVGAVISGIIFAFVDITSPKERRGCAFDSWLRGALLSEKVVGNPASAGRVMAARYDGAVAASVGIAVSAKGEVS